ncbi:hypothetical protein Tco_0161938 [Tanacetum coccineum]
MAEFMANMNRGAGGDGAGGAGAGGAGAGGAEAGGAGAGGAGAGGAGPAAPEITGCTYVTFMKCDPQPFKGTEGAVGLCQWFEKLESVFRISDCKERDKVKFTTATLQGRALTWWNGRIASMGIDAANGTPWTEVRKWMTEEFCPRSVLQRLEQELMVEPEQLGAVDAQQDPKVITELGSFDIIIGMDWLSRYDAAILCGEKKIEGEAIRDVPVNLEYSRAPVRGRHIVLAPSEMKSVVRQLQSSASTVSLKKKEGSFRKVHRIPRTEQLTIRMNPLPRIDELISYSSAKVKVESPKAVRITSQARKSYLEMG